MSARAIPLVNLQEFLKGTGEQRLDFVGQLSRAFKEIGFVGVINHGIPDNLVSDFYSNAKSFFSLPESVKRKYEILGLAGQRGYTSFGKEHAKQSRVADLKEFYQIGQTVVGEDEVRSEYPDNVMTSDIPEFTALGDKLYKRFEESGAHLLRAIALGLNLPEDYFASQIRNGNSILRAIHYPPIIQEPDSAIRAEQHEDINLITLLVGASAGGLQVLTLNGDWLDVVPQEGEIVVNVGDMLQRLTNNVLKSTTHRVVNPPKEQWHVPRLSIPFFLHPRSSMDLSCLPSCVSVTNPLHYEPITAGEYLNERLREIGLKK
ncbi:MAG: isopenicillin N synthase family oxygenase [Saprospiraceae bacterium]|nr:isopenicillin N synthase family oxygenase [Saprospiraceae bacterium]